MIWVALDPFMSYTVEGAQRAVKERVLLDLGFVSMKRILAGPEYLHDEPFRYTPRRMP